jgi:deoxyxylulose-5-phosphate synthase
MTKKDLIDFEKRMAQKFDDGEMPYLVHFSGGNEDQLIELFKEIDPDDYVFSTHRSHYHYLLHGGDPKTLEELILSGNSMFVFDRKMNFYSSSIVCATPSIATGVAWALKRNNSDRKVWCFLGDGAEDEGHFYEAVRYVSGWNLPCTFIIEDNNRSVSSTKQVRWNEADEPDWPMNCVRRYSYEPSRPHGGSGTSGWMKFKCEPEVVPVQFRLPVKPLVNPGTNSTTMKYIDAVTESMVNLANSGSVFIGYNVRYGSAYGTLKEIPEDQRLETPLAENLMAGLAIGMSLEGIKPVLFFERHDFIYNALDALVNQVDKIEIISRGEFKIPIVIRAVAGSIKPFYSGITHTSNLTSLFKEALHFPIYEPLNATEVINAYKIAQEADYPVLISEDKGLY